jgi:putative membrane protein
VTEQTVTRPRSWRPAALRSGTDPDPRFTLANERTFLAWIRTALGIMAAALALEALSGDLLPPGTRQVFVCTLLGSAIVLVVLALNRWFRIEVAMRAGRSLPIPAIAVAVTLLGVVSAAAMLGVILA